MAGVKEAVGELEEGEPVNRDASDFHVCGHQQQGAAAAPLLPADSKADRWVDPFESI